MNTRTIIAATLLAGASLAGGLAATAASDTGSGHRAAEQANAAGKALKKRNAAKAIAAAEEAVALQPRNGAYRTLLGQAYLAAGRFQSAAGALGDALALNPSDGTAALHLVLAQIATGDWAAARDTLTLHEATISPADRGLALALAGDPATAVAILDTAARRADSDAKTRQNYALALGLAGRWADAKTVAAVDVSPAELDSRILQWISFAKPQRASDQIASLLGVTAIEDAGQPERLALRTSVPNVAAVAQTVDPVDAFMPGVPAGAAAPTPVAAAEVKPVATAEVSFTAVVPAPQVASNTSFTPRNEVVQTVAVASPRVTGLGSNTSFTPRNEVVQTVAVASPRVTGLGRPAPVKAAAPRAVRAVRFAKVAAKGNFVVQLGAFASAGVAKDAWGRLSRRHRALAGYYPNGTAFAAGGATYYRLSVGGFARGDAVAMCRSVRIGGGRCFVRAVAGDTLASWSKPKGVQLASR